MSDDAPRGNHTAYKVFRHKWRVVYRDGEKVTSLKGAFDAVDESMRFSPPHMLRTHAIADRQTAVAEDSTQRLFNINISNLYDRRADAVEDYWEEYLQKFLAWGE